jgi:ASC-1-like (ASCH) protein
MVKKSFCKAAMHHVAIMNKSWKLIPKILSGEKTIESRWYQTRRTPWDKIKKGDIIYFKNSGESVTAKAMVAEVMQFEFKDLDDAVKLIKNYGKEICLVNKDPGSWARFPKYCILMRLINPLSIKVPFNITKTGFGMSCAWLTVPNISKIKL